ncbi:origin recognition complex subunit 2-like [Homalodisca vitripennis]|uniref:origin recognition complex subunit 2-like n=1 Tax=Homalodisca vitripennis TaxID=197043 RepID=UPI001EEA4EA5|nr:origin recognition complex subunit 2-like [Homalodisca vitripennis]
MSKRSSRLITRAENETINTVVVKAINDEDVVKVIVGTNLTSVPVLSTQKLTTKRGRPRKKLTEDEVKSEGVEEDSDNESKSSETCEKPSGLCDDDDLDGGEMCSFRTPKKRQGMLYKAEESASKIRTGTGTPKTKPSTPSHKTPIKALTPSLRMTPRRNTSFRNQTPSTKYTPKKSTGTPRRTQGKVDIVVPKTPYQLRVRQKKAIQAYTRQMEDFDDGDSDFQGSDCSSSESEDSEQESNKEEESDKEEEESDSDSGKGSEDAIPSCRRSLRFQPPPATPSCKKRGKEFNYVFTADEYFRSQSDKCITSDHNLSRLKSSHTHLPALSLPTLCPSHQRALASRRAGDMHMFQRWMFALSQGFSILAYGLGSKYKILQKFHKEMLSNSHVVVVNGFFPSINIKREFFSSQKTFEMPRTCSVLIALAKEVFINDLHSAAGVGEHPLCNSNRLLIVDMIARDLLGLTYVLPSAHATVDWIESRRWTPRVFLLVHNLDAEMLRCDKTQRVLSRLASLQRVHLVASVDHINCPLLWDQGKLSGYNFMWEDVTTLLLPYVEETSYETSLMAQNSGTLALSSLLSVYRSLPHNSRGVFRIILEKHLDANSQKYTGMAFSELYGRCREEMLVTSDLALRTMLTEFLDHQMVKWRRDEHLYIPTDLSVLRQFHSQIQNS